jgi:hypothetical protein
LRFKNAFDGRVPGSCGARIFDATSPRAYQAAKKEDRQSDVTGGAVAGKRLWDAPQLYNASFARCSRVQHLDVRDTHIERVRSGARVVGKITDCHKTEG